MRPPLPLERRGFLAAAATGPSSGADESGLAKQSRLDRQCVARHVLARVDALTIELKRMMRHAAKKSSIDHSHIQIKPLASRAATTEVMNRCSPTDSFLR
jgi:hypothetical protein